MELTAGARLRSSADETEVIIVRTPAADVDIRCGGHPMVAMAADLEVISESVEPGFDKGTQLGKRYVDEASGLEILCTKGGKGSLSVGDVLLGLRDAKPLPSSD
jgi:hypothetical protein